MNILKYLEETKKYPKSKIYNALEISKSNYSDLYKDLENGKILSIKKALILSEHFRLSLDEIYGISKEEQQAGIHATVKIDITPLEDDLLDVFREIGEKLGEPSQRAFIEIGKSILEKIS